jgi:hypothetical protein
MRVTRWRAVAVVATLAALGVHANSAAACTSNNGVTKWYGVAWRQSGPIANGSYANIYASGKGAVDWSNGGFIANVLWNAVDGYSSVMQYWIEAGDTKGWEGQNIRTFYWARNVPNVSPTYREHQVLSITPSVGSYMPVELLYQGSSTWGVYFNFQIVTSSNPYGQSYLYNTTANGTSVAAGLESTNPGNYSGAAPSAGLDYLQSSGSWAGQFPTSSALWCDPPATSTWDSQYHQQRSSMN